MLDDTKLIINLPYDFQFMKQKIEKRKTSNKKISFIFSLIYVGLGTIYALTFWTEANTELGFNKFLFYFFMPSSFILEVILFAQKDPFLLGLLAQIITFFFIWGLSYCFAVMFRKDQIVQSD